MSELTEVDSFVEFVRAFEPRLKQALVAAFGADVGAEATAEALAFGWENWDRVQTLASPIGYLYGVGRNKAHRWHNRKSVGLPVPPDSWQPAVEPALIGALDRLSERQRVAVMLVHCFEWTLAEVAAALDVSKSTVQQHLERGMTRLRREMGEVHD